MLQSILMAVVPWGMIIPAIASLFAVTLIPKVTAALHINTSTKTTSAVQSAIQNALTYGLSRMHLGGTEPSTIATNRELLDQLIKVSMDYLDDNAGALLTKLGVGDSAIAKSLEAQALKSINNYVYAHAQIKAVTADPTQSTPSSNISLSAGAAAATDGQTPASASVEVDGSSLPPIVGSMNADIIDAAVKGG